MEEKQEQGQGGNSSWTASVSGLLRSIGALGRGGPAMKRTDQGRRMHATRLTVFAAIAAALMGVVAPPAMAMSRTQLGGTSYINTFSDTRIVTCGWANGYPRMTFRIGESSKFQMKTIAFGGEYAFERARLWHWERNQTTGLYRWVRRSITPTFGNLTGVEPDIAANFPYNHNFFPASAVSSWRGSWAISFEIQEWGGYNAGTTGGSGSPTRWDYYGTLGFSLDSSDYAGTYAIGSRCKY